MGNLVKNDADELTYKTEQTHGYHNQVFRYQRGNMGGSDTLGDWD